MHTDAVPAVKHDERCDRDDLPREPRRQRRRRRGRRSVVVAVIKQCSKSSRDCYSDILSSLFSLLSSLDSRLSTLFLIMTMNEIYDSDLSASKVHPACNMNRGRQHKKASCGCEKRTGQEWHPINDPINDEERFKPQCLKVDGNQWRDGGGRRRENDGQFYFGRRASPQRAIAWISAH